MEGPGPGQELQKARKSALNKASSQQGENVLPNLASGTRGRWMYLCINSTQINGSIRGVIYDNRYYAIWYYMI